MAEPATIAAIVRRVRELHAGLPVSIALGEFGDWNPEKRIPKLPAGIAYLKLGTAGLGNDADRSARLQAVIDRFRAKMRVEETRTGETASDRTNREASWIAVGYADWELARGPRPEEVIEQAAQYGCKGILFDTFSKGSARLVDWFSVERMVALSERARSRGLLFALAGRLQMCDLSSLRSVDPDVVGIRSAACRAGIRTGEVDAAAVRAFREALGAA